MAFQITCNLSNLKKAPSADLFPVREGESEQDSKDRKERNEGNDPIFTAANVDVSPVFTDLGDLGAQIRNAYQQIRRKPDGRKYVNVAIVLSGESELTADDQAMVGSEFIGLVTGVLWGSVRIFDNGEEGVSVSLSGIQPPQQQRKEDGGGWKLPDPDFYLRFDAEEGFQLVPAK